MKKLVILLFIPVLTSCITIKQIEQPSQQNSNINDELNINIEEQEPDKNTDLETISEDEDSTLQSEDDSVYFDYNNNEITGHYENDDNYFDILLLEGEEIQFQAFAMYMGQLSVNTGELADIIELKDNQAVYSNEDGCELTIIFSENKIDVEDSKVCGGLNVTFDGQYLKTDKDIPNWDIYEAINDF